MIQGLQDANLSESYDKGAIGTRKTLATALSALLEYVVRGISGGFAQTNDKNQEYDISDAEDLERAFRNSMDGIIYGNIIQGLVDQTAKTDQLTDHVPVVQAVHEFVLVK